MRDRAQPQMKSPGNRKWGWKPDLPDQRDFMLPALRVTRLPKSVDLRRPEVTIFDQLDLGSCTANAIASAFQFELLKQRSDLITPSRLFIYYNERVLEGSVPWDDGAYIRDGFRTLVHQGTATEQDWPYQIGLFASQPPKSAYENAMRHQLLQYFRLTPNLVQIRGCLAQGYPFVFGFTVYESFLSDEVEKTGVVPLPGLDEYAVGGHAVLAVGYDDASKRVLCQNSWGPDWGDNGCFTMPYAYLINPMLADDFWTMRRVEG